MTEPYRLPPERLEQLLAEYPHRPPHGDGCCLKHVTPRLDAHELADEVRALQRDLDLFRDASEAAELRIVELRAIIAERE